MWAGKWFGGSSYKSTYETLKWEDESWSLYLFSLHLHPALEEPPVPALDKPPSSGATGLKAQGFSYLLAWFCSCKFRPWKFMPVHVWGLCFAQLLAFYVNKRNIMFLTPPTPTPKTGTGVHCPVSQDIQVNSSLSLYVLPKPCFLEYWFAKTFQRRKAIQIWKVPICKVIQSTRNISFLGLSMQKRYIAKYTH